MYTFSTLIFLFSAGLINAGFLPGGLHLSSPISYSSGNLISSGYSGLSSGLSGLSSGYSGLSSGYSSLSSGYLGQSGLATGYSAAPVTTVYTQAAPATNFVSSSYSAPTAHAVYQGPSTVQNIYEERARVVPGEEYVYKVRAAPKVHKEVVHTAQIVQKPKVLYSEVVAPKVERVTVVQQENPQVVNVQPQVHKESVVLVQPKTKQQIFVTQKRRDTVAKKTEYETQKFATTHQDGHNAYLVGTNTRTAYAPVYGNEGYTQTGYANAPLSVTGSTYETTNYQPQTSFLPSSGSSSYSNGGQITVGTTNGGFSGLNGGFSGLNGGFSGLNGGISGSNGVISSSTGGIHNQYKPSGIIFTEGSSAGNDLSSSGLSSSSSSSLSGTKN